MILFKLFFEYFKIGLFSIGGGLATIPFLSELSERTGWFTQTDLADMIAISESTPGPIGVNMASNVGFSIGGIPGVITATLGLITPSVIVVLLIIRIIEKYYDNPIVTSVFSGLRPASMALITVAGLDVALITLINKEEFSNILQFLNLKSIFLAIIIFFGMKKIKIHPIFFILFSALVGILFNFAP